MRTQINRFIFILVFLFIAGRSESFMFWNQACYFPGNSSGYISFPNSASLNITGSFTIEMWLNPVNSTSPSFQILSEKRSGAGSNGYTLYLNQGRISIRTNASTRLIGKTVLQNNKWTHITGSYNSSTGNFSVFINGMLDTTAAVSNAQPESNTDSLRIGSGNANSPFNGMIDEYRIWNRQLTGAEINRFSRTTLGTATGIYSSLVLSLTFQDKDSQGTDFSLFDWTGKNNTGKNIGAIPVDLSNRPSNTIMLNDCIELNGTDESLCGADNSSVSPTAAVTLEAWIFTRSSSGLRGIIYKGNTGGINYGLRLNGSILNAVINGNNNFNSTVSIQPFVWTHVCFTYNSSNGQFRFYVNGRNAGSGVNSQGPITDGTDSLVIGSSGSSGTYFNGFIDEVRISNYVKSRPEINRFLYQSIDRSNRPNPSFANVVYNFDGYAYDNSDNGPVLQFKSGAEFAHSGTTDNQPVSPLNRSDALNFSNGFRIHQSIRNIPASGTSGIIVDSFRVSLDTVITDINLFLALNHTAEEELSISLQSPDGSVVNFFGNHTLSANSDNIISVFDDQADSSLSSSPTFTSFSPRIKPKNPLNSVFGGKKTAGVWKLIVNDLTGAGTGKLYSWGMQFNSSPTVTSALSLKVFMEGFYRSFDSTVVDTVKVKLRESYSPYNEVGIKGETPDEDNVIRYNFPEADLITNYYIQVNHRNSIEIWSDTSYSFDVLSGDLEYNFTLSADAAYGSNQQQVELSPGRFAMFAADVDQNGIVDLTDNTLVDNDAFNFASGYVSTDVNGDETVDLADQTLADNNSFNFVAKITP
ncbi:MAG: proprotein convertase P-domain-containing protein [Bacteroidetes bacterium]|nr:proprotein convertase P-domain-containing protein [Bacteroidota bacterium]